MGIAKAPLLKNAKPGDYVVDEKGTCYQLTEVNSDGSGKIGKYIYVSTDGTARFSRNNVAQLRLATLDDIAAWRARDAKKQEDAKKEADAWYANERKRDAAEDMYKALCATRDALKWHVEKFGSFAMDDKILADALAAIKKADGK